MGAQLREQTTCEPLSSGSLSSVSLEYPAVLLVHPTWTEEDMPVQGGWLNILFADGHVKAYRFFEPGEMTFSYIKQGVDWESAGP